MTHSFYPAVAKRLKRPTIAAPTPAVHPSGFAGETGQQSHPPSLPTVRALAALYEEVRARPLWLPPTFLTYLRLRRRMRLGLLDARRATIVTPKGKINDCAGCSDSCCIGHKNAVLLRLTDLATLIDVGRTDLVTQNKPVFSEDLLRARPALRRQVGSEAWRRMPVLRQSSWGACQALDTEGRCTLYPHWPLSCARFPLSLDAEAMEIFYAPRCRSFYIHPKQGEQAQRMAVAAVASYNERIKDAVLLAYAPKQLQDLGLMQWLAP